MALTFTSVREAVFVELAELANDLARIAWSQAVSALRGLISSPTTFVALLFDLPNKLLDRIGDSPARLVQRLLVGLTLFPLDKSLRSRVLTANEARSWCLLAVGEQIVRLADSPSRATARGGARVFGGGVEGIRARIEKKLGEFALSTAESLTGRILRVLLSPARLVIWFLQVWDVAVALFTAIVGFGVLVLLYGALTQPPGKDTLRAVCLPQTAKRVREWMLREEFVDPETDITFALRGPPYARPPWSTSDVTQFGFTAFRRRRRVRNQPRRF